MYIKIKIIVRVEKLLQNLGLTQTILQNINGDTQLRKQLETIIKKKITKPKKIIKPKTIEPKSSSSEEKLDFVFDVPVPMPEKSTSTSSKEKGLKESKTKASSTEKPNLSSTSSKMNRKVQKSNKKKQNLSSPSEPKSISTTTEMNRGITELPKINGSKSKSSLTSNSPNKTGDHPRPRPVAHATSEGSNNTIVWNIIEEKMANFRHEN